MLDADMDGLPDACDDTPQPAENTTIVEEDQTRPPSDSTDQTDNQASLLTRYPIEVLLVGGMVLVGLLRAYTRSSKR